MSAIVTCDRCGRQAGADGTPRTWVAVLQDRHGRPADVNAPGVVMADLCSLTCAVAYLTGGVVPQGSAVAPLAAAVRKSARSLRSRWVRGTGGFAAAPPPLPIGPTSDSYGVGGRQEDVIEVGSLSRPSAAVASVAPPTAKVDAPARQMEQVPVAEEPPRPPIEAPAEVHPTVDVATSNDGVADADPPPAAALVVADTSPDAGVADPADPDALDELDEAPRDPADPAAVGVPVGDQPAAEVISGEPVVRNGSAGPAEEDTEDTGRPMGLSDLLTQARARGAVGDLRTVAAVNRRKR